MPLLLAAACLLVPAAADSLLCTADRPCPSLAPLSNVKHSGGGYVPTVNAHFSKYCGSCDTIDPTAGSYWWTNHSVKGSFRIAKLDDSYKASYFANYARIDNRLRYHPPYVELASRFCGLLYGRKPVSVLELGNGGGVFTHQFLTAGYDIVSVEGTRAGYEHTLKRGVPAERLVRHDLRLPLYLSRRFDIALLTEVVEHVEPIFSSQVVLSAVLHADVVWFSYKVDGKDKKSQSAGLVHPNERPAAMWINLFDFYGYDVVPIPSNVRLALAERGTLSLTTEAGRTCANAAKQTSWPLQRRICR